MNKTLKIGDLALLAIIGILFLRFTSSAQAQATVRYWDTDGTNPGLGVGGPYDWILDDLWNTDHTGGAAGVTGNWTDGDTPIFNGNGVSTVTISSTIDCTTFSVGNAAVDGSAVTLNLSGSGTLNCSGGYFGVGFQAADTTATNDSAVLNMSGGTINLNSSVFVGRYGCSGTLNMTGGSMSGVVTTTIGEGSYPGGQAVGNGIINVSNALFSPLGNLFVGYSYGGAPTYATNYATLNIYSGGTAAFGTVYICNTSNEVGTINVETGGVFMANLVLRGPNVNGSQSNSIATLNFNGGCFRGRKSGLPTIGQNGNAEGPIDAINIQSGGAIFDTAGFTLYITQGLMDGGGGGGLTKTNTGNLVLDGASTYTGGTTIEQGTLFLQYYTPFNTINGSISNSAFINIYPGATVNVNGRTDNLLPISSGQILEGGGTVTGNLTVNGTVAPGNSWAPSTMSLTDSGVATLAGTAIFDLNRTNTVNSDQLICTHPMACGGALIVSNVGPALVAGDTFRILQAGGLSGTFSSTNLPALPGGLAWATTNLYVNGTISVESVATPQPLVFAGVDYSHASSGIIGFSATNGTPNGPYTLLTTTNLAQPIGQWTVLTNGNFDANGNLSGLYITNLVSKTQFFRLDQ